MMKTLDFISFIFDLMETLRAHLFRIKHTLESDKNS